MITKQLHILLNYDIFIVRTLVGNSKIFMHQLHELFIYLHAELIVIIFR
jgi:hypothetical protein